MGRPRQFDPDRTTTAIRLPPGLLKELQTAADERDVSINLLVTKAVEHYLPLLIPVDGMTAHTGRPTQSEAKP